MQACSESRGLECSLGYSNSIVVFIRRRIRGAILTGCVRGAFYAQVASKREGDDGRDRAAATQCNFSAFVGDAAGL